MVNATNSHYDALERVRQTLLNWQPTDAIVDPQANDWSKEVTIIATTFERPRCILQLLTSIRQFYPTIAILVCETSREPLLSNRTTLPTQITWFTLPFAQGHTLGASRNHLVQQVRTKYFFLCDDDHVFTAQTDLEAMHRFLECQHYDLVGGCQGKGDYGAAIFEQHGDIVYQHFYRHHGLIEAGVVRCDRVSNTFLARTAAVRQVLWEPRVYASEHAEFFLRATRQKLKIAQMGGVYVDHKRTCEQASGLLGVLLGRLLPHRDRGYQHLRDGGDQLLGQTAQELEKQYCFEKNGIKAIINVSRRRERGQFERLMSGFC